MFRKGQITPKDNPQRIARPDSGFVQIVSTTQEPHIQFHIGPALKFLADNEKEIERLKRFGVDNMLFDSVMEQQQTIERAQYLPPELIAAMGRFHMGPAFSTVRTPQG